MATTFDNDMDRDAADFSRLVMIELRRIAQAIDRNSKSLIRRVGLTMPQLLILRYVAGRPEVSVGTIAKKVHLSDATVTGILERLEKRGYIARRKSKTDRRRVLIRITDCGDEIVKKAPPLMQEGFVEAFNALPNWNQTMIYSSVQQLADIMNAGSFKLAPLFTAHPMDDCPAPKVN